MTRIRKATKLISIVHISMDILGHFRFLLIHCMFDVIRTSYIFKGICAYSVGLRAYSIGIYCKRFAQSAGPGSQKAWIRELCFAMGVLFGVFVGWFFDHWKHFVSAGGPTFDGPIRFGRPKAPHEAPTPESLHFVGPTWGSRFDLFFLHLFPSIVFCWVLGQLFHVCWLHFNTFFEYFIIIIARTWF